MQIYKYKLRNIFKLFIMLFIMPAAFADNNISNVIPPPDQVSVPGCTSSGYIFQQQEVRFNQTTNASGQRLYLLKNKFKQPIWIDHPVKDAGASAGWASQLKPLHWSALALDKSGTFAFSCAVQANNKLTTVPCSYVLQVCQMTTAVFDNQSKGSYWVVENQYIVQLLALIASKNIKW